MQLISYASMKKAATPGRYHIYRGVLFSVLALLAVVAGKANAEKNGEQILSKVNAVYGTARSFEGNLITIQKGQTKEGKIGTVTVNQQLAYKDNGMFALHRNTVATGGPKTVHDTSMAVSDGKHVTVYSPTLNKYQIKPTPPVKITLLVLLQGIIPASSNPGATLLAPTNINGRAAFVVQLRSPSAKDLPATVTPAQRQEFLTKLKSFHAPEFTIDKENFHILKITRSMGPNSMELNFISQSLNGLIADSAFKFKVPSGAKLAVAPAPQPTAPNPFMASPHN